MAQATFRRSIPLQDGSTIRTTYDKASKMYDITRVSPTGKELDSDAVGRDYVEIAQDAMIQRAFGDAVLEERPCDDGSIDITWKGHDSPVGNISKVWRLAEGRQWRARVFIGDGSTTIHSSKKGALAAIHLAFENRRRSALSA